MEIVQIHNIQNGQIFQQTEGFADIPVNGQFLPDHAGDFAAKGVWLMLLREDEGTHVIRPVFAPREADGRFQATLSHVPAGGMYTLLSQLGDADLPGEWERRGEARFHLGVGDIYLIAGQSNAAGYGKTPGADEPDVCVHLYSNGGIWQTAAHPMSDSTGSLHPINAEWATAGSCPWLRFGNLLHKALHYPIGLLQASKGDSYLHQWLPAQYSTNDPLAARKPDYIPGGLWHVAVDVTSAIGKIAGVLWYQGENDADEPEWAAHYGERFALFVSEFRHAVGQPELPFYTVQLNKNCQVVEASLVHGWGQVKEAQRLAARTLPHVYVTPAHDLPMSDRVHNNTAANGVIGERTAWLALEKEYRRPWFGAAPDLETATLERESGQLMLHFTDVAGYLVDHQHPHPDLWLDTPAGRLAPLTPFMPHGNTLTVRFDGAITAKLTENVTVSFGVTPSGHPALPIDRFTGIPPLGFYQVPVVLQ